MIFFFIDSATSEIYTLSLHDALPIWTRRSSRCRRWIRGARRPATIHSNCCSASLANMASGRNRSPPRRSEEHTSELQSPDQLVCRLLLEKKNDTSLPGNFVVGSTLMA